MKMKKILTLLASAAIAFGASAYAAGFEAVCDSQKGEIKVTIFEKEHSAPIMVYLTDADVSVGDLTADNIGGVKLIAEVKKGANGYEATLKLPKGIESGDYVFTIADYKAVDDAPVVALADRQCAIYVAGTGEIESAISAINGSTTGNINSNISGNSKTLSIDTTDDFGVATGKAFMAIKGDKTYSTLEAIQADYAVAKAIGGLADASADEMSEKLDVYAGVLGITLDEDYTENSTNANKLMEAYFDADVIGSDVLEVYPALAKEAIAVASINGAKRTEIHDILVKYEDILDIDLDGKYADTDKTSFNKALERKDFKDAEDVKKAFDDAVKALSKKNTSGGGGGGGGSSTISYSPAGSTVTPETPVVPGTSERFNDLAGALWAKDAIVALADKGIVSGYADGSFGTNNNITRNEFLAILVRAFGLLDETAVYDFTDGDASSWYANAVASAKKAGIIAGYADGSFGDGTYITREDMATFIYRLGKVEKAEGAAFADADAVSAHAKEAVEALSAAGIINGTGDGNFAPKANATRAQVAVIINKMIGGAANE